VVGGQRHAPAALPPGKTRYLLYRRLGGPQCRSGRVWKISPSLVFDTRTVQPVARCYTDWAIPDPEGYKYMINNIEQITQKHVLNWILYVLFIRGMSYVAYSWFLETANERLELTWTVALWRNLIHSERVSQLPDLGQEAKKEGQKQWWSYEGNSISKLQIQVAIYVFELSAGNWHR
jgi:hypothetical protein